MEHEEATGVIGERVVVREWKEIMCPSCGVIEGPDPEEVEEALQDLHYGV